MTLENNILKTLKEQHITPLPRRYFLMQRFFQVLFFLLLVSAGIVLSSLFLSDFGENIRYFRLKYILFPIGWLLIIGIVGVFAFRDIRHIGRMYRFSLLSVLGIIVFLFFLGGILGYRFGIGQKVQAFFSDTIPGYHNISLRDAVWTDADNGRLAGIVRAKSETGGITLEDINGKIWQLQLPENTSVEVGTSLRFLGTRTSTSEFAVVRVMPWFGTGGGKGRMMAP